MKVVCLQQLGGSLVLFGQLVLGIYEVMYLDHYSEYKLHCCHIWEWLAVGSIVNVYCGLILIKGQRKTQNSKKMYIDNIFHFVQLVVSIWASIVYFDKECNNYWNINAKELWNCVIMHYAILWVIISNILISITKR